MKKFLGTHNGRASVQDPLKAFNYVVEIDRFVRAGFSKANMPEGTASVIKYREGGANATASKSPGLVDFSDIVLERGVITAAGKGDKDIYDWWRQVFDATALRSVAAANFRRQIDIVLFDRTGREARRWRVKEAWVSKFKPGSDLGGQEDSDLIETATITHEGFYLVGG